MRLSLLPVKALALLGLPFLAQAVYPDEVGNIDFHYDLVGIPQSSTTFFHKPRKIEKASLLYTLSDVGVLGAVNPSSGAVVWRQLVAGNTTDGGGFLRAGDNQNWLCGAYGSSVHAWDALTGRNIWWMNFENGIKDLEILELTEDGRKDVLVLIDDGGATLVRRLHGDNGSVVWEFRDTVKDVPLQVSTNVQSVFAVGLHGSPSSYSIKVSVLDIKTGTRVNEIVLGTKGEVTQADQVMFVGSNSAAPIIAWVDPAMSSLRVNVIGTKSRLEFPLADGTTHVDIHAPHLAQSNPHFLVHMRTKSGNRAEVYHVNLKTNEVSKAYDLPHLPGSGAISTSTDGANVYFTRVTEDEVILVDSTSHGILGRWPLKHDREVHAVDAVSEVVRKPGNQYAIRSAVTTTSGDWALVKNGEMGWIRPEGMSGAVAAAWAEIPEYVNMAKVLEAEAHTNPVDAYIRRVKRHISDLRHLPDYLATLPTRLINGIVGSPSDPSPLEFSRDTFGFRRLIIIATRRGRLYALDTGNHGKIVWSKKAFDVPEGSTWDVKGMLVNDLESKVQIMDSRGRSITVKADTGEVVEVTKPEHQATVSSTAIVDTPKGPWLLPVDPQTTFTNVPIDYVPEQTIVVRDNDGQVKGVKLGHFGSEVKETVTWMFTPPAGQDVVSLAFRPIHDPVASIGRVLGDRKVKYKYLNPNTLLVAAVDKKENSLTTYLLDSVSGQVLTSTSYEGVDTTKTIECAMSENWFACTFFGQYTIRDGSNRSLKGYQIAVTDLYESEVANDRGPLGDAETFSASGPMDTPSGPVLPSAVSQSWILSSPLERLAVTQTRQGITRRQLLAYLPESRSIIGLPRELIDPRRPLGRDPTKEEMEAEGLPRYTPQLELDPRAVVSHVRDVLGVREIIAVPAVVESTSLVLAYGVDVFASRVAPSQRFDVLGKEFSKTSLLGTVGALALGVWALRPLVRRRQINQRWQAPS